MKPIAGACCLLYSLNGCFLAPAGGSVSDGDFIPAGEGIGDGQCCAFVENKFVGTLGVWRTLDGNRGRDDDSFVAGVESTSGLK